MFPPVFAKLKANNAVKAIVGTNPPHIWRKRIPDSVARPIRIPYITWFVVVGVPEESLEIIAPLDRVMVQVDCFHTTDSGVQALAQAARDALEPFAVMTGMPVDEKEAETELHHVALQFDWFVGRPALQA